MEHQVHVPPVASQRTGSDEIVLRVSQRGVLVAAPGAARWNRTTTGMKKMQAHAMIHRPHMVGGASFAAYAVTEEASVVQ